MTSVKEKVCFGLALKEICQKTLPPSALYSEAPGGLKDIYVTERKVPFGLCLYRWLIALTQKWYSPFHPNEIFLAEKKMKSFPTPCPEISFLSCFTTHKHSHSLLWCRWMEEPRFSERKHKCMCFVVMWSNEKVFLLNLEASYWHDVLC